jgi:hypothetical protein
MKKPLLYLFIVLFAAASCRKEYSAETDSTVNGTIVGLNCRISGIGYTDKASGVGIGSINAIIDANDNATNITNYDSLNLSIVSNFAPQYNSNIVTVASGQYFVIDNVTKQVKQFHGFVDPTAPGSPQIDVDYTYNATGYLINKVYRYTASPGTPFQQVVYSYSNGNLTGMVAKDLVTGYLVKEAQLTYINNIAPKSFMYLFPDESAYASFNQFYNFGKKSYNAVKDFKVHYYDPGNMLVDSSVSLFSNYILSRDNYVVSVLMNGGDQSSIPAYSGKLKFSYKCK